MNILWHYLDLMVVGFQIDAVVNFQFSQLITLSLDSMNRKLFSQCDFAESMRLYAHLKCAIRFQAKLESYMQS